MAHSVFPKISTHSDDCALSNAGPWGSVGEEAGEGRGGQNLNEILKNIFKLILINLVHFAGDRSKLLAAFVFATVLSAANKLRRLILCAFISSIYPVNQASKQTSKPVCKQSLNQSSKQAFNQSSNRLKSLFECLKILHFNKPKELDFHFSRNSLCVIYRSNINWVLHNHDTISEWLERKTRNRSSGWMRNRPIHSGPWIFMISRALGHDCSTLFLPFKSESCQKLCWSRGNDRLRENVYCERWIKTPNSVL